jgi:hypothetical protein
MSTQSHMQRSCKGLRKELFSTWKYAEIHLQRQFLNNYKGHIQNYSIENTYALLPRFGVGFYFYF